jgi:hypothetical protein
MRSNLVQPGLGRGALCLAALLAVWMAVLVRGQQPFGTVVINEAMADNATTLVDDAGNNPDWVELYNTGAQSVILSGWKFTDKATTNKFTFPPGTVILPFGYLIIYCDDGANLPGLHAPFKLSSDGSYLRLTNDLLYPNNKGDAVTFGLQLTDYSVGRIPNGSIVSNAFKLTIPSPRGYKGNSGGNVAAALGSVNGLRINEWAATNSVLASQPKHSNDWLEIYNPSSFPVAMGGLVMSSDTVLPVANNAIPNLSFIPGEGFFRFWCMGNKANDNNDLDFKLSHQTGETISIFNSDRRTWIDRVTFSGNNTVPGAWSVDISYGRLPDGAAGLTNIVKFAVGRTTPGESNFQPLTGLVVNEVLSHTDPPLEDAVEFYNPTATQVDISGWWLSNATGDRKKFRIPANTIIQPFGFKVFYEMVGRPAGSGFNTDGTGVDRSFTFNSEHGDRVVLSAVNASGAYTGYQLVKSFGAAQNGISFGRYVDSTGTNVDFVPMSRLSLGTSVTRYDPTNMITVFRTGTGAVNPSPQVGPLVISEIHFHPPDVIEGVSRIDDSTNEFIEIYNPNGTNMPLYDPQRWYYHDDYQSGTTPYASGLTNVWRIRGSVDFEFPTNVWLAPSNYLLMVNFSPTNLAQSNAFALKFDLPAGVQVFGPYNGKLSNKNGSIELQKPDWPTGPGPELGFVPYLLVEDIQYSDSPPWPTNSDGRGFSLHRVSATGYGNDAINWVDSIPSPGRSQTLALGPLVRQGAQINLGFGAQAGLSYTVQGTESFGPTSLWSSLQSYDPRPTNWWCQYTIDAAGATSNRYFRVVSPKRQ